MQLRFSAESKATGAFLAGAVVLVLAAWLAVSSGRDYVSAAQRIDELLRRDDVLSDLSSTTDAAPRTEARAQPTKRAADLREQLRAERDAAHRHLDAAERAAALVAALTITLFCYAYAALMRILRERRRLAACLGEETPHDPLTGLPSRRFFAEWLSYAIAHARRQNGHVGVLFIDIGGCVEVAELHGGPAVEALLVEIARRFRAAAREGDVFARLGASEFALATPSAGDGRQLASIAQRLRDALDDPAQPPLADTPIGTSIGIAFFPEDAGDPAGIMAAANAAMYAARRAGRNHVAFNALAA
ncbi:MAG TPA: GGDEF domain-containing protein [Casimicrobiaceae bacterium]